jgi:hypothetical protein
MILKKKKITSMNQNRNNEKNHVRVSCWDTADVVTDVLIDPRRSRFDAIDILLLNSSFEFCSQGLNVCTVHVTSRVPIGLSGWRRSKYCRRILCTSFWLTDVDDVSRRRTILKIEICTMKANVECCWHRMSWSILTYLQNVVHEFLLEVQQLNIFVVQYIVLNTCMFNW